MADNELTGSAPAEPVRADPEPALPEPIVEDFSPPKDEGDAAEHQAGGEEAATQETEPATEGEGQPKAEDKPRKGAWKDASARIAQLTAKFRAEEQARQRAESEAAANLALLRELQQRQGGQQQPQPAEGAAQQPQRQQFASQQDFDKAVEARSAQKAAEMEFNERCNRTFQAGSSEFEDFAQAANNLNANFGDVLPQRQDFFDAITQMPDGHRVFYHLANTPDDAARLLQLSPIKMAMELQKLSTRLGNANGPRKISAAPKPVTPVKGNAAGEPDVEHMSMEAFAALEAKKWNERRNTR